MTQPRRKDEPERLSALLPDYHGESSLESAILGAFAYLGLLLLLAASLPPGMPDPALWGTMASIGLVALWRWSWGALHLLRALIYRWRVFPAIRRKARSAPRPPALYVLVTSYRMSVEANAAVYGSLFDEVAAYGAPSFIVACITDPADARIIGALFDARRNMPSGCSLRFITQDGTGKRSAMAEALAAIAEHYPLPDAQIVLMDGDTVLGHGALRDSCAILACQPDLGAITTSNTALVKGHAATREWYRVRLTHRDCLMASMSLSRKLLVLTGRFSVFRAAAATTPDFILAVERDSLDHPRHGRITMLTGDDKSTWFCLMRHGWAMLYVPDVLVFNLEELPGRGFLRSSVALMARWYGNMARNNGRALALGPRRCGLFTWFCLLDQRLSPWTGIVSLTAMLFAAVLRTPAALQYYLIWVLLTRGLICAVYALVTRRFHPLFPMLLYYNQLVGAWVKIYAFFHQNRQKWNRQAVSANRRTRHERRDRLMSDLLMAASVVVFAAGVGFATGALVLPGHRAPAVGLAALLQGPERAVQIVKSANSAD